jgi:D-alanyl-lipoteichoic acid acyltransferase DltB (MBOAT superfamily)
MELFSLAFVIFVVLALAAYYAVGAMLGKGQWVVLLVASLAFYCIAGGVQALGFVLFASLVTWVAARYLGACDARCKVARKACADRAEKKLVKARFLRRKRVALVAALVLCLLVLGYAKYYNVILFNFGLARSPRSLGILLPLGISFFTFQSLGYLIDAYNGRFSPQENFARYLLFVGWFPQLIQGPINKYEQTGQALLRSRRIQDVDCRRAALRLGYGVFKKVAIANLLFPTYESIFSGVNVHTPGNVIVLGIVVYSVYMYADFSGGIDIVEGISELFGIQMAQNFRQPYFSVSLSDFWRRWHMSLGAWMRDYLFYPFALLAPLQRFGKWATKAPGTPRWPHPAGVHSQHRRVPLRGALARGGVALRALGPVQRRHRRAGGPPCPRVLVVRGQAAHRPRLQGLPRLRRRSHVPRGAGGALLRLHRQRDGPWHLPAQHAVQLQLHAPFHRACGARHPARFDPGLSQADHPGVRHRVRREPSLRDGPRRP